MSEFWCWTLSSLLVLAGLGIVVLIGWMLVALFSWILNRTEIERHMDNFIGPYILAPIIGIAFIVALLWMLYRLTCQIKMGICGI